ncbi:MAG TPA: peptidoglycan bridge formation glycyltransferase FemA/FemB family protein [Candidatus Peribacteria bacterium]|nr:peptidoglycan bridge formation glycyltransferase FemA/FemB family protein [Candidatus Peribacteria bacterium]
MSTVHVRPATDAAVWDAFLAAQPYRPFLQSWTMGDVYADIGQTPVRLQIEQDGEVIGICFGHVVPARRGRHLSVPYGPLFAYTLTPLDFQDIAAPLLEALRQTAKQHDCAFVRCSPFLARNDEAAFMAMIRDGGGHTLHAPLHLLAEQVWYLPLTTVNPWQDPAAPPLPAQSVNEEELFKQFRSTTRNLIRRAEKDGVTVRASRDPNADVEHFLKLHDETRQRHGFTPYTNAFFRAQVKRFAARSECTVYLAEYQGQVIASSVHMHAFGETSYHHGANADAFKKIPSSYLLQWTAIKDAIQRGDRIYNFWGIAPLIEDKDGKKQAAPGHPFSGVTLFKTGFGGNLLELARCLDIPLTLKYHGTRAFEVFRKWRRGF